MLTLMLFLILTDIDIDNGIGIESGIDFDNGGDSGIDNGVDIDNDIDIEVGIDPDIFYNADAGQGWFNGQAYGDPGMYEHLGNQFWGPTQQVISLTASALSPALLLIGSHR